MKPRHATTSAFGRCGLSLGILLAFFAAAAGRAADGGRADEGLELRDGITHFPRRLASGEYTKMTFFGGAASAGEGAGKAGRGVRDLVAAELRAAFPKCTLSSFNSAIPGMPSPLAVYRTGTEPLYGGCDLVFLEFAVDDAGQPRDAVIAAVEGIVRQIRRRNSRSDVVLVYAPSQAHLESLRQGRTPEVIAWHEEVARHYGLPSVNLAAVVARRIEQGRLKPEEVVDSGGRPTDRGHALYAEILRPLVKHCRAVADQGGAAPSRPMPKPLSPSPLEKARCVPYEWAALEGPWAVGQKSDSDRFLHLLVGREPSAVLSLRFTGAAAGCYGVAGPDSGDWEFAIDGGPWQRKPARAAAPGPWAALLAEGLDPVREHVLQLRPAAAEGTPRVTHLGALLVNGDVRDPLGGKPPLERIDAIYAAMKPLDYTPPAGRWKFLPRTMQRLREGPSLKIVMLGDSIVSDTASSNYELLWQRLYPRCTIEKIRSVRGSTGCWWYKDDNRVQSYVLDHRPDLLVIGGISQRDDVEAIRDVIRQVRAKQEVEVLLMTPAFGIMNPDRIRQWTYDVDPAAGDYRARLRALAGEEKAEFLDMTGPWWKYVQESGHDYGWFRRDAVHANDRGFQILGRILEKYIAPR